MYELDKEYFEIPSTKIDNVTLIEITLFKGRSIKSKKALYKAIVNNLASDPRIDSDDIVIVVYEPPLENWSIKGGKVANEVDLEFEIKV